MNEIERTFHEALAKYIARLDPGLQQLNNSMSELQKRQHTLETNHQNLQQQLHLLLLRIEPMETKVKQIDRRLAQIETDIKVICALPDSLNTL